MSLLFDPKRFAWAGEGNGALRGGVGTETEKGNQVERGAVMRGETEREIMRETGVGGMREGGLRSEGNSADQGSNQEKRMSMTGMQNAGKRSDPTRASSLPLQLHYTGQVSFTDLDTVQILTTHAGQSLGSTSH